jgi:hypothetical protein
MEEKKRIGEMVFYNLMEIRIKNIDICYMSTYKLLSYNTSWVNDACNNQLHNFLSESASIVAKARALNRVNEIEPNKLDKFRMELADQATSYIKEKMDAGYDFIALIEQTIHVPKDSHANYDSFGKKWTTYAPSYYDKQNMDIINKINTEMNNDNDKLVYNVTLSNIAGTDDEKITAIKGMVPNINAEVVKLNKTIDALNGVRKNDQKKPLPKLLSIPIPSNQQDVVNNTEFGILRRIGNLKLNDISVEQMDASKPYSVVYDQVINPTLQDGPGGEGIGIAFKTSLVDTMLVWNQSVHPVRQRLLNNGYNILGGADFTKSLNEDKNVHYYSDDMGDVVCYDESRNLKYYNGTGAAADLGRPIIMTAGVKGQTLQIFVALHGPNIFNMKFNTSELGADGNPVQKQLKEVVDNTDYDKQVINMFDSIGESIGRFINAGLNSATNKDVLSGVDAVNLFVGGDANDPRSQLLQSIMIKGIQVKINNNFKTTFDIKFGYFFGNDFGKLYSCCANADSIKESAGRNIMMKAVGPIESIRDSNYPDKFYKPENFGYNGDYALFGSYPGYKHKYVLKLDDIPSQYKDNKIDENDIIVSDHLPVISYVSAATGGKSKRSKSKKRGGRRTRKNNRKTRKNRH